MKKLLFALLLAFTFVPPAYAHKGHDQRIMGTVTVIQDGRLEVKAANVFESAPVPAECDLA